MLFLQCRLLDHLGWMSGTTITGASVRAFAEQLRALLGEEIFRRLLGKYKPVTDRGVAGDLWQDKVPTRSLSLGGG